MERLWDGLLNEPEDNSDLTVNQKIEKLREQVIYNSRDVMVLQLVLVHLVEEKLLTAGDVVEAKKRATKEAKDEWPEIFDNGSK